MKKRIALIVLALACMLILSACGCEHEWTEANCVNPKTCSLCGEIEGAPLGHSWLAATCSAAKTCEICGEVQGEPLAHTWVDATCTSPKTCSVCAATEGEPLEHTWIDATYEAPKTCEVCGTTEGEPLAAPAASLGVTYDEFISWLELGLPQMGYELNSTEEDSEGVYWDIRDAESGEALPVYLAFALDTDGESILYVCGATEDIDYAGTLGELMGMSMVIADNSISEDDLNALLENTYEDDGATVYYFEKNGLFYTLTESDSELIFLIMPAS